MGVIKMKIIVSAGGTGGHLYPALALVEYIKTQDIKAEFLFVGTTDRLESQVVPQKGYAYKGLKVKGLVGNPLQKIKNAMIFVKSLKESKKILKEFQPDIVVGFGGYPSASIVLAAAKMNIPTMIHEQNSIIGLTNKILIKKVDKIVCCYEKAYNEFPHDKTVLLGNPRASVVTHQKMQDIHDIYNIPSSRKTVVIVMGSLGSSSVNKVMKEALRQMQYDAFDIVYVTGKNYYDEMKEELKDKDIVYLYITGETSPLKTWENMIPDIHGEHYRVTAAQWNFLGKSFNVSGVPTYLIIDREGNIKYRQVGFPGVKTMKEELLKVADQ